MAAISRPKQSGGSGWSVPIWVLLLTNLLVYQLTFSSHGYDDYSDILSKATISTINTPTTTATATTSSSTAAIVPNYALAIPEGQAENLPSIRVAKEDFKSQQIYGGKGDKSHLGGWTDMDHHGVSPAAWKWMVQTLGIHSLLDIGCGRGISTTWFAFHGVDVLCVEGSHDARDNTVLPSPDTQMIEHDFSRGPWWPAKTYDAIWCVEFLEHVGRNFHKNYLTAFRKAAIIFATHSLWGGHHHVEVHDDQWWIQKMSMYGFVYSEQLTNQIKRIATDEKATGLAPNGVRLNAQHVWLNMQVFINPAVASLPQHAHLLAEPGCFLKRENGQRINRECGEGKNSETETRLPPEYRALELTEDMDTQWFQHIQARVQQKEADSELKQLYPAKFKEKADETK